MDVLDSVWAHTPPGTGGPKLESVRTRLAAMVSTASRAPSADAALAERAKKSAWYKP